MVYWETAHTEPEQPPFILEYARVWQAADKVVYSTTLPEVTSARTRIERTFDPDAVRELKAESDHDITIDGPHLAAHAIRAGLVDEYQLFVGPAIVGGGNPFFPATCASISSCWTSGASATAWSTCVTASRTARSDRTHAAARVPRGRRNADRGRRGRLRARSQMEETCTG